MSQVAHQAASPHLRFLQHEVIRSISSPPWMGCLSAIINSFIPLGGERHCESKLSCTRKLHDVPGQGSDQNCLIQR